MEVISNYSSNVNPSTVPIATPISSTIHASGTKIPPYLVDEYAEEYTDDHPSPPNDDYEDPVDDAVRIRRRLDLELSRAANVEVRLPDGLLDAVTRQIVDEAEQELYGLRGCTLYVRFEGESSSTLPICTVNFDPCTVSTFELVVTLRQDLRGWKGLLPTQFMRRIRRGIVIDEQFDVQKTRLYRSYSNSSSSSSSYSSRS